MSRGAAAELRGIVNELEELEVSLEPARTSQKVYEALTEATAALRRALFALEEQRPTRVDLEASDG